MKLNLIVGLFFYCSLIYSSTIKMNILNNNIFIKHDSLLIQSIEIEYATAAEKYIYTIKAKQDTNSIKIVSIGDKEIHEDCLCNKIAIGKLYSFPLYSWFLQISHGETIKSLVLFGIKIDKEEDEGYSDIFGSPNLKGLCLLP